MDFIYYKTELYTEIIWKKYWNSMYHAVMLFGGNEMAPRSTFEIYFASAVMLFSAMVNANIFGQMAVLVQDMNKKTSKFQEQFDTANTAMKNLRLPSDI